MGDNKSNLSRLAPVMLAFFTMGFVDMVGTATNYVKADFALSDTMANFLPSMVFLWFFFLSIPIGLMMNKIGKRKTVLLSLVVTALAFILPLLYLLLHFFTWLKMKRINHGRELNTCLEETARNMMVYGLCVSIGLLL